ncbi:deazaflavin-dependent oxidoreductase (nitroreductase family) [Antricoccus suffuscus]|uniref:Deazaflavin-dependent oxidoreductase (Nitroreductase family) n=1 Tax=Antricoccus suffuscus TaxID=1629062 RepID=A0A2T1A2H1_9ACTN|nr:nitroreductase family deazaflavin-dependent oxidoreductase [Antricoccus suffuscus]PRZ42734.1 deazaflavin-dependent oxidoreductase (nitroreductase family) [Antricoccus suffuscus]
MRLVDIGAKALRTRGFVRAPIYLYRTGLGFLLGHRMLMLQHIGRKSGARRYVVLEVVEQPSPLSYVVASGFGTQAQWYRNVLAHPRVGVSVGFGMSTPARAVPLTDDEVAATLQRYQRDRPRTWSALMSTIESATGRPVTTLPMVRLELQP